MKHSFTWSVILWVAIFLVGCTPVPLATPVAATDDATPAPDFRLTTLDGQTITLSDLRGRWVLINFWATWCIPCREEMPYLQVLADAHADQMTVLGINMRESAAEIQPFVEKLGITFPLLLQPDNETLLAYNIRGLPLSFVVSPSGELVLRQVGPLQLGAFDRWLAEQLPHE